MAKVFTIEPNPHWVIIDNFSKLPNGAAIYTYRSLNPTEFKPAFQDAGGNVPYGQPIVGFGNGTMPPIFWEFDDTAPTETYYIEVWSAPQGQQGVLLWTFNGLTGGSSGGGGGTITTNNDIENLIINGEFYLHVDDTIGPSAPIFLTLAPSNNHGIGGLENVAGTGPPSPDIIFSKSNQSDTDQIQFVPVFPLGSNNLGLNPTPEIYVRYICTNPGAGQTHKYIQFPVVKGLQNLSGIKVSIQMYARLVAGSPTGMVLSFRQFFGNGISIVPSSDVIDIIGPATFSGNAWTKTIINAHIIPSIATKSIGECGNDALFFQINFPLSSAFTVEFILPAIYLGETTSNFDFHTLDMVNAIVCSPRTGDIRFSLNNFTQYGWLAMNDGTIGNVGSGASERGATDTFQLYSLIWRTFKGANEGLAPMSGGAYGADPVTDFSGNRTLTLTKTAGRVLAAVGIPSLNSVTIPGGSNTGTNWGIGQSTGNERHTQSVLEMPSHSHTGQVSVQGVNAQPNINANINPINGGFDSSVISIGSTGGGNPFNVQQPTSFLNVFVKL